MANNDTPFGLRPIRHRNGAPYNGATNPYLVPAGYGTALFIGDPVVKTSTANAAAVDHPGGNKWSVGTLPEINKAAAATATAITGVVVAFSPDPTGLENVHRLASTERVAWVADDPDLIFEIQEDGVTPLAVTQIGLNANLIFTHAGNTATGLSGVELDTAGNPPATTVDDQLKILRLVPREDNEVGAWGKYEVMINVHTEAHGVVGL